MTRGERVIAFIERHCRVPEGKHVGKPLRLEPFQKRFLLEVYDNPAGTNRAILSIARKNGKTGLIAAMLLAHIAGPEAVLNSQIASGAMSKDQAGLVFRLAEKMIGLSPELSAACRTVPSQKIIVGLARNVEFKALSADKTTAHGQSLALAILDEIGQVKGPTSDFVDAIVTAQGAYDNPLLIAISTQAPTDADLLSVWIDDAKSSKDKHIVCHVYEADKDCVLLDKEQWKKANPALGKFRSVTDLKKLAQSAARLPSQENSFRNLNLNQRVSTLSPFISKTVWESCGAKPEELTGDVCVALDLSSITDLSSLTIVSKNQGFWDVEPYFWAPEEGLIDRSKRDRVPYDVWAKQGKLLLTPGRTIDYSFLAEQVRKLKLKYKIRAFAFDPWRINDFLRELRALGIDCHDPLTMEEFKKFCVDKKPNIVNTMSDKILLVKHMQGYKEMTPSINVLEKELLNARIRHGMHPIMTMCAANAVIIADGSENKKLTKSKSNGRIDGIVSLCMALGVAVPMQKLINAPKGNDGSLINLQL